MPSVTRLLLIESNETDQRMIQPPLDQSHFGYQCEVADSIDEAIAQLSTQSFQAVILNAGMSDDRTLTLVQTATQQGIPVIVFAQVGNEETVLHLMQQGASSYFTQDPDHHYLKLLPWTVQQAIETAQPRHHLNRLTAYPVVDAEIEDREAFLYSIYAGVDQAIFTVDVLENGEFRFVGFNPAAERIMGQSSVHMRGKPAGAKVRQHYADCLQAGDRISYEECLMFQDVPTWWLTTLNPIRDACDRIVRIVGTSTDITDRKQAEMALQSLIDGTATTMGEAFFPALVSHIARALEVRHVAICRSAPRGFENLAFLSDGNLCPPHCFSFASAPYCWQSLQDWDCLYLNGLQHNFPNNPLVKKLQAESYLGMSLRNLAGDPMGILAIFHDRPLPHPDWAKTLLKTFAARAGAELERYETTQALKTLTLKLEQQVVERTAILQEREAQLRDFLENANDLIQSVRLADGKFEYVNRAWRETLGYSEADVEALTIFEVLHPDCQEHCRQTIAQMLTGELQEIEKVELLFLTKTQEMIVVEGNLNCRFEGDRPVATRAIFRNITERQRHELALRQSEERYRALMDNASDAILLADAQGNLIEANQKAEQLLGYSREELTQLHFSQLHPPEVLEPTRNHFSTIIGHNHGPSFETLVLRKDGSQIPVDITGSRVDLGGEFFAQGIFRDIRDRKQVENALRQSQQFLQTVLDSFPLSVFWKDRNSVYLGCNRNFLRNAGLASVSDLVGKTDFDLPWAHTTADAYRADDQAVMTTDTARLGIIETQLTAQGTQIWLETNKIPLHNLAGQVIGVLGTYQDITDRKQTELENQQLRERLQFVLSTSPAVIFTCKPEDDFGATFISDNITQVTGYTPTQFLTESDFWADHIHPDDAAQVFANLTVLFDRSHHIHEYRFQHQQGHYIWVRNELRLVRDAQGNPVEIVGYFADITDRKQIELDLQKSEAQFRQVFESSVVGMVFADFEGHILHANDRFLEIVGYTRADLDAGLVRWNAMTPPEYAAVDERMKQQLSQQGRTTSQEKEYYRKDGSRIPVLLGAALLPNSDNQAVCVVMDISDRKQAERKLKQQADKEHLVSAIAQRIRATLNLQDILDTTVAEVHQVLQSDRVLVYQILPDGTGKTIAESVSPGWTAILNQVFPEEIFPRENYDRYVNGRIFALTDTETGDVLPCLVEFLQELQVRAKLVVPIIQRDTLWGLVIAHQCGQPRVWQPWEVDVLHQLSGQLAIAIQQSELYAQLQTSHQQLTYANAELLRATRLKDEFLANMSHELRTPLNAILGMSESLQDEILGSLNKDQKRAIATVEHSGQHLLGLINDILELSKIEAGKLELDISEVSIAHLCRSSLSFVKQQAFKKQVQLNVVLPHQLGDIAMDERRMRQVLINLLTNGVKFTSAGGRVTLEAHLEPIEINLAERVPLSRPALDGASSVHPPTPNYYVCLSVTDTGIGITAADQAKLFQPFVQIDSRLNRRYEGTGLGLALVKRIVELHGGNISLRSEPGQGSCFTVRLPYTHHPEPVLATSLTAHSDSPPAANTVPATIASIDPIDPPLILLAEDNEANISTIANYLEAKGYRISVVHNGRDAIDFIQTHHPDLVLMDIQMPEMDGLEAIQVIRQDITLTPIPIIALTALAMDGDRDRCLAAGANDYLAKPVSLRKLAATIAQHLIPS